MVLVHAHPVQLGGIQFWREALPYRDCQVLSRRNASGKFQNFFVQKAMVHSVEDFAVHGFFELLKIDHESGARIDLALDSNFEDVIVPVSVGVVALAEQSPVLLRRQVRIVVIVRRGEFSFSGEIEHRTF